MFVVEGSNRELALFALGEDGVNLEYCDSALRADREVVRSAPDDSSSSEAILVLNFHIQSGLETSVETNADLESSNATRTR